MILVIIVTIIIIILKIMIIMMITILLGSTPTLSTLKGRNSLGDLYTEEALSRILISSSTYATIC